jgi:molybdenum cofactor cytidylyltransferase
MIGAVILAAGASRRMGSPKALLTYRGETFLNRLIRVYSEVCDPVVVVTGYHAHQIRESAGPARMVQNPDPERGQLSSLQTGLQALPAELEGFLFTPVDSPAVDESTVRLLIAAFRARAAETMFVIPRFEGKRGHPVLAAPELIREFLDLPLTAQAKDIVHQYVPRTQYVDVNDPGILADIDDQEAYRQLVEAQQQ